MTRKPSKPAPLARKAAIRAVAAASTPARKGAPAPAPAAVRRPTAAAAVTKSADPHKGDAHKADPHKKVAATAPSKISVVAPIASKESPAAMHNKKTPGAPETALRRGNGLPEDRQSQLKLLIGKGKEQGYLTYAQVNDHLPAEIVDPEQIEGTVYRVAARQRAEFSR